MAVYAVSLERDIELHKHTCKKSVYGWGDGLVSNALAKTCTRILSTYVKQQMASSGEAEDGDSQETC